MRLHKKIHRIIKVLKKQTRKRWKKFDIKICWGWVNMCSTRCCISFFCQSQQSSTHFFITSSSTLQPVVINKIFYYTDCMSYDIRLLNNLFDEWRGREEGWRRSSGNDKSDSSRAKNVLNIVGLLRSELRAEQKCQWILLSEMISNNLQQSANSRPFFIFELRVNFSTLLCAAWWKNF